MSAFLRGIILELQKCQEEYEETLVHFAAASLIEFERELTREHVLKDEIYGSRNGSGYFLFQFLIQSGD